MEVVGTRSHEPGEFAVGGGVEAGAEERPQPDALFRFRTLRAVLPTGNRGLSNPEEFAEVALLDASEAPPRTQRQPKPSVIGNLPLSN